MDNSDLSNRVLVVCVAMPTVRVTPDVTDIRQLDDGLAAESVCSGRGRAVTVRWNTSELDPDVEFDVSCGGGGAAECRLRVYAAPTSRTRRARVHCIAANDVGNDVHAWTLYESGKNISRVDHNSTIPTGNRPTQSV